MGDHAAMAESSPEPVVVEQDPPSLVYMIGRINHGVRRELQRRLARWELSVPELTALSVLRRRPGLSNAQLARRSMITPQSMNEVVAGLERRGLVARRPDPAHGGILQTRLTPAGRGLLRRVQPAVDELQDKLLTSVPDAEREIVLRGFAAAMRALSGRD
jgi:DNA-binding MarR family transcriptional regulator